MNAANGAHMIANEARDLLVAKWERGEREHGGSLFLKPVLDEAINEALDQTNYLLVLRRQVERVKVHLREALTSLPPETSDPVQKALNILEFGNAEGV